MLTLGFVSAILPDLNLEEVLAFAASNGFSCVELMCWPQGKAERRYAGITHIDVVGFTKSLAIELGPDNIRVNAILPGAVDGPRIRRVIQAKAASTGVAVEDLERIYTHQASLCRMVDPQDIARMALFLAGSGGRNVSGQALAVDGDTQALV